MKKITLILMISVGICGYAQNDRFKSGNLNSSFEQLVVIPFRVLDGSCFESGLPRKCDLSLRMPPADRQGKQSSCTAWAVAYGVMSFIKGKEYGWNYYKDGQKDPTKLYSPAFLYNHTAFETDSRNCDFGMSLVDAFYILYDKGAVTLKDMPYDPNDSLACLKPDPAKDPAEDPILSAKAAQSKILFPERVINRQGIKFYLSRDMPVAVSLYIDQSFKDDGAGAAKKNQKFLWNPNQVIHSEFETHSMVCVGYDDDNEELLFLNSWGYEEWGNCGLVCIKYKLFDDIFKEGMIAYDVLPKPNSTNRLKPTTAKPTAIVAGSQFRNDVKPGEYWDHGDLRLTVEAITATGNTCLIAFSNTRTGEFINETYLEKTQNYIFYMGTQHEKKVIVVYDGLAPDAKIPEKGPARLNITVKSTNQQDFMMYNLALPYQIFQNKLIEKAAGSVIKP
jgi:hypothetical protein